ncbi:MAG TPA: cellulase family glycosylhydrolase, partial [Xanthobacteraceae bacterium]|nr:cellulase family glycosylhydrolase [Xanthobacteraceae bacterium]
RSNPDRTVIIGPGYWNSLNHLQYLQVPQQDRNVIITFHYYQPFHFTHQGEESVPGSERWIGTSWGTAQDLNNLQRDFQMAAAWAKKFDRPLYLGEFGSTERANREARLAWTRAVVTNAAKWNFSWSYWKLYAGFGVYDMRTGTWDQTMLNTLLGKS